MPWGGQKRLKKKALIIEASEKYINDTKELLNFVWKYNEPTAKTPLKKTS